MHVAIGAKIPFVAIALAMGCSSAPHEHPLLAVALPTLTRPFAASAPNTVHMRLVVGGDLLAHRPQLVEPELIAQALAPLSPLFREADAAIANYEGATGNPAMFKVAARGLAAPTGWSAVLLSAGLRAVTVANNHACDLGKKGLLATVVTTEGAGLTAVGAGATPWAPRVVVERSGKRVCLVAWTTLSNERENNCMTSGLLAYAPADARGTARAQSAIAAAKELCDATVAVFHGGEEYEVQTERILAMARAVAEAGAAAVVIHHPHVVSPMVVSTTRDGRRVPIFASVGNLVSNQGESWEPRLPARQLDPHTVYLNGWTRLGMLADLDFEFAERGPATTRFGYRLTWGDNDHFSTKDNPHPKIAVRLLGDETDESIVRKLLRDKSGPGSVFQDKCRLHISTDRPACE